MPHLLTGQRSDVTYARSSQGELLHSDPSCLGGQNPAVSWPQGRLCPCWGAPWGCEVWSTPLSFGASRLRREREGAVMVT